MGTAKSLSMSPSDFLEVSERSNTVTQGCRIGLTAFRVQRSSPNLDTTFMKSYDQRKKYEVQQCADP